MELNPEFEDISNDELLTELKLILLKESIRKAGLNIHTHIDDIESHSLERIFNSKPVSKIEIGQKYVLLPRGITIKRIRKGYFPHIHGYVLRRFKDLYSDIYFFNKDDAKAYANNLINQNISCMFKPISAAEKRRLEHLPASAIDRFELSNPKKVPIIIYEICLEKEQIIAGKSIDMEMRLTRFLYFDFIDALKTLDTKHKIQ